MKKMKKPFYLCSKLSWVIVITALTGMACSKMLVESPKSLAVETFYNTAQEVESAVNAIYPPLRTRFPEYVATLEAESDFMYGRGSWENLSLYQGFNDANINRVVDFWDAFYVSIRNANLVIKNAPSGSAISQADIDKYVSEARFLRAFSYFQLARNWAGVPLRTEVNLTEKDVVKTSVETIYNFIVADLLTAEKSLPEVPSAVGRPSKWAAKTLLADVYLQLGKYSEAATKAGEVIQSNKFSLVKVSSKSDIQNKLFGPSIVTSTEEIFYLKYSRLENQGNYLLFISNHPSTGLFKFGGAYAIHGNATNPNYAEWDNTDLRKELFDKINFGLGPNTLVSSKWVDKEAISNRGAGNDFPAYRYADVLLMYAEAIARAEKSVSEDAMEALNKVHRRAYGFAPDTPSSEDFAKSDYEADSFINLVIKERGYEFVYEGKRWLELKRNGKVDELILAGKGKTVAAKHLLWPIPVSELNYNKALDPVKDQNPGY